MIILCISNILTATHLFEESVTLNTLPNDPSPMKLTPTVSESKDKSSLAMK